MKAVDKLYAKLFLFLWFNYYLEIQYTGKFPPPPPVLFLSSYTGVEFMTVNSNVSDHLSLNITVSGQILDRVRLQIKKAKITRGEKKPCIQYQLWLPINQFG